MVGILYAFRHFCLVVLSAGERGNRSTNVY